MANQSHSGSEIAIRVILDRIEADLQLAWDHIQDAVTDAGTLPVDLAEHQLRNAIEKVNQIRDLKGHPVKTALLINTSLQGGAANASNQLNQTNESTETITGPQTGTSGHGQADR